MSANTTMSTRSVGELVNLSWKKTESIKSDKNSYAFFVCSRYICVREATEGQSGILVKVRGKISRQKIMLVEDEPFCKDDRDELFTGRCYYSFKFPTTDEVKEVLEIIRQTPDLKERFEKESMHFDPYGTFWVRETASRLFGSRLPQYYDASTGQLHKAKDDDPHYRITMVYFDLEENKDK